MTIDLKSIRSARIIEGAHKIADFLERRLALDPQLAFERDDDGALLRKATAGRVDRAGGLAVPSDKKLAELADSVGIEWSPEMRERVIPYWASDERVDAHGDIVKQNWDFSTFEDNPVLVDSHLWHEPPIGSALDWGTRTRSFKTYDGPSLWLLTLFATGDMNERAESMFRLVRAGFLRGGSVGFRSGRVIEVTDDEERAKLGLGRWGVILDDNELLEFSTTTIGANAGAMAVLASAARRHMIEPADIETVRESYRREVRRGRGDSTEWDRVEAMVSDLCARVFPDERFEPHKELDEPMTKTKEGGELDAADPREPEGGGEATPQTGDGSGEAGASAGAADGSEPSSDDDAAAPSDTKAALARIEDALTGLAAEAGATLRSLRREVTETRAMLEDVVEQVRVRGPQGNDDDEDVDQETKDKLERALSAVGE